MQRIIINGGKPLKGAVEVSGAKNAALPILAATVLTHRPVVIDRVPAIKDVRVMMEILRLLGVEIEARPGDRGRGLSAVVSADGLDTSDIEERLMRLMRSSIFLMGGLLGRTGRVRVSHPGGCAIGPRPIDIHLRGLKALGAQIEEEGGYIHATARQLRGAEISLDYPSVGATENLIMAAVLAHGTTVIKNCAREPEIRDLAAFLNGLGARVEGAGTDTIAVDGVSALSGGRHMIIPDRIEAGTFAVAAAVTGGEVYLEDVIPDHMDAALAKLREAGVDVRISARRILVRGPENLHAIDIKTGPYPGFPTDLQNQFLALACVARGTSIITETVFENRFKVAEEFRRMGADLQIHGRTAIIKGVRRLSGAAVESVDDLRGSAALILAGLAATGTTVVEGVHHVDRGYERFAEKLQGLGAELVREP